MNPGTGGSQEGKTPGITDLPNMSEGLSEARAVLCAVCAVSGG